MNTICIIQKTGKLALDYLLKRGLSLDDIKHFQIGLAPKERNALYQILKNKGFDVSLMMASGLIKSREDGSFYDFDLPVSHPFRFTMNMGVLLGFSGRALGDDQVKYLNTPETDIFTKGKHYTISYF